MKLKTLLFSLSCGILLCSCGSSKNGVISPAKVSPQKTKITKDECQVLAEKKPETRAYGRGSSYDLSTAEEYAELDARAKFARAIASKIVSAQSRDHIGYDKAATNANGTGMVRDEGAKRNSRAEGIAEEVIRNAVVINTSQYQLADGSYEAWVCLEYREGVAQLANEISKKVEQQISDEDRLKMNFEFEKFRKHIEEELKSMKAE